MELLDVKDLARLLRLSTRQIHKLTKAERLPAPLRIGRSVRWVAADVRRFIECGADPARYAEALGADR